MRELTALDRCAPRRDRSSRGLRGLPNERLTEKIEPFRYVAVAGLRGPVAAEEISLARRP